MPFCRYVPSKFKRSCDCHKSAIGSSGAAECQLSDVKWTDSRAGYVGGLLRFLATPSATEQERKRWAFLLRIPFLFSLFHLVRFLQGRKIGYVSRNRNDADHGPRSRTWPATRTKWNTPDNEGKYWENCWALILIFIASVNCSKHLQYFVKQHGIGGGRIVNNWQCGR